MDEPLAAPPPRVPAGPARPVEGGRAVGSTRRSTTCSWRAPSSARCATTRSAALPVEASEHLLRRQHPHRQGDRRQRVLADAGADPRATRWTLAERVADVRDRMADKRDRRCRRRRSGLARRHRQPPPDVGDDARRAVAGQQDGLRDVEPARSQDPALRGRRQGALQRDDGTRRGDCVQHDHDLVQRQPRRRHLPRPCGGRGSRRPAPVHRGGLRRPHHAAATVARTRSETSPTSGRAEATRPAKAAKVTKTSKATRRPAQATTSASRENGCERSARRQSDVGRSGDGARPGGHGRGRLASRRTSRGRPRAEADRRRPGPRCRVPPRHSRRARRRRRRRGPARRRRSTIRSPTDDRRRPVDAGAHQDELVAAGPSQGVGRPGQLAQARRRSSAAPRRRRRDRTCRSRS